MEPCSQSSFLSALPSFAWCDHFEIPPRCCKDQNSFLLLPSSIPLHGWVDLGLSVRSPGDGHLSRVQLWAVTGNAATSSGVGASEGTYSGDSVGWDGSCRVSCLRSCQTVSPGGCAFRVCSCSFSAAPGSPGFSTALPALGTVGLFSFSRAEV